MLPSTGCSTRKRSGGFWRPAGSRFSRCTTTASSGTRTLQDPSRASPTARACGAASSTCSPESHEAATTGTRLVKILIVGAGPAGLYLAYLLRRQRPDWLVRLVEQNPPDSTFGFGVVFSDRALEFLRDDDAETCELVTAALHTWTDLVVAHRGTLVRIDGMGFAAIDRLELLRLLQTRLARTGVM